MMKKLDFAGISTNKCYKDDIALLEFDFGWQLDFEGIISFEEASNKSKGKDIVDLYFTDQGTLIFINHKRFYARLEPKLGPKRGKTLWFQYAEAAMDFALIYCEDSTTKRYRRESKGTLLHNSYFLLDCEVNAPDFPTAILSLIREISGWESPKYAHAYRYKLRPAEKFGLGGRRLEPQKSGTTISELSQNTALNPAAEGYCFSYEHADCLLAGGDQLWFGSCSGAYLFGHDGLLLSRLTLDDGRDSFAVHYLSSDNSGTVWFSTSIGLISHCGGKTTIHPAISGIDYLPATCMFVDSKKNLWIGTREYLCVFDGSRWKAYRQIQGLPGIIRAIVEDRSGRIWLAADNGIFSFNGKKWDYFNSKTSTDRSLSDPTAYFVILEGHNSTWMVHSRGLRSFQGRKWAYYPIENGSENSIVNATIDKNDVVWIFTSKGSVFCLKEGKWHVQSIQSSSSGQAQRHFASHYRLVSSLFAAREATLECTKHTISRKGELM